MQTSSRFRFVLSCVLTALLFGLARVSFGQVVSAGMTGLVHDSGGKPVAAATVTATHVPTGTSYTAATKPDGRYYFRGLIAGGPYTVETSASGFKSARRTDVDTQLGSDVDVNFTLTSA